MLYHSACSRFFIYFYLPWSVFDNPSFLMDVDISLTIQFSVSHKCFWLNVIVKVMTILLVKVKGEVHSRTGHKGPKEE